MPTIGPLHHPKPGTEAGRLACSEQRSICLSVSTSTHASFAGEVQWNVSAFVEGGLGILRFESYPLSRGLADARARGKTILRLRVALEDSGWNLTSASARVSTPVPTPDRLKTALNLAKECELLSA